MLRVYDCLTQSHDLRLVAIAALICLFASYTAISLEMRAVAATRGRWLWLMAVGAATGSGIWATHFVAMLAFRPDLPVAYEMLQTVLSLVVAMAVTGLGFAIGARPTRHRLRAAVLGGVVIGLGVFFMHFVGMAAVVMPATLSYDRVYAIVALLVGILFSILALRIVLFDRGVVARIKGAAMLSTGICGLHFTAMAAVRVLPDPTVPTPQLAMPSEWLAVGIALTTLIVLATALIGSLVDQRFSALAEREAERLRATVAELEATKEQLERTGADLRLALEAAATSSQAKSQFLAAMSHELRTPLNAVIGFSEALGSGIYGMPNERQRECLDHIHGAGRHLLQLVNDVLDLSKMNASRLDLDESELSVDELFASVTGLLNGDTESAGVVVRHSLPEAFPMLRADGRRVRQVLINLLCNAIKFTPSGGSILLDAAVVDGAVVLTVADTGIGIEADDIPVALERFGQVDSRIARKYQGTGLGLPLSKQLMELHDGTLELESTPGVGTTVTVRFPPERVLRVRQAA